ncbi:lysyl oxidase-like protein 2/3/4 [Colletotrichum nymphaeae SA-01]|uniref:Amine oxidase n=1 Tax=Colletotrichum nymphaeae SA-01 TaxID=1460502 RepID=A0A135T2E7_9PEZI|nr:lysyl oxidase-like protein 2/3/4 [Colletotrichum nymphaeae SA-01]
MPATRDGYLWTPSGETTGLSTKAVVDSTPESFITKTYDVVVIGTGFAGLIAARNLSRDSGTRVLLLEGRDRIGGRTWTANALGDDFEMGGTWVHWKVFSRTAAVENTSYTPQDSKPGLVDTLATNTAVQNVADAFFSIDGLSSRELMPYPHDPFRLPALWMKYDHLSAKDRLDQLDISQNDKDLFDAMISSFGAVPGSECGFTEVLRWYALGGHSMAGTFELAGMYKLGGGGMTSLARAILDDYRGYVVFNAVVEKVEQQGSTVVVATKNGRRFEAKYCISTIPLNCLSDVSFSPPLSPLRMEAVRAGHINKGSKVHFRLAKPEPGWFSMANGYGTSPWCFAFSDHNGTTDQADSGNFCIGFGYGARHIDPKASTEMITTFQNNIRPEADVTAYLTHDWANDSLAKGTWSCWGPNSMSKWLKELQRPEGRVHFASADWADGWRGFIDGAIERGTTVGREVEGLLAGDNVIAKL